jgi:spoIIIJ-associated protein
MEWVETTAKTVDEAKELALDQLGVDMDDAEFEILQTPRPGLFGRMRGEARVRARVRPTAVRPKLDDRRRRKGSRTRREQDGSAPPAADAAPASAPAPAGAPDRRQGSRAPGRRGGRAPSPATATATATAGAAAPDTVAPTAADTVTAAVDTAVDTGDDAADGSGEAVREIESTDDRGRAPKARRGRPRAEDRPQGGQNGSGDVTPPPEEEAMDATTVGAAAEEFMTGLLAAFGLQGTTTVRVEGDEIELAVAGDDLGLLIGPRGTTLIAVQDLARVASQRRLGDHDTRLRIDIGGYRERRREALGRFALQVAEQVKATGSARRLEPMPSADRKIVHDALAEVEGIETRSDGEEPFRRVVIAPRTS